MNMGIRRRRAVFREVRAGAFFGGHSGARQGKDARTVGTIGGGKDAFTIGVFKTLRSSFGSVQIRPEEQKTGGTKTRRPESTETRNTRVSEERENRGTEDKKKNKKKKKKKTRRR